MVDEMRSCLRHSAAVARRTDTAALAREGHDKTLPARRTACPAESEAEDATGEVRPQLPFNVRRNGLLSDRSFADRWGWDEIATDWQQVISRDDIDIVDIATPTALHYEMALAAARAGKQIFCEKPLALNVAQARGMADAVREAGVTAYVNHNYRRVPAVMLAKHFIDTGRLGWIFHWRGAYLQS